MSKTPHARPRKAASRGTVTFYVRIPRPLRDRLAKLARTRGYPHTLTSVAGEGLAAWIDHLEMNTAKNANDGEVGHGG